MNGSMENTTSRAGVVCIKRWGKSGDTWYWFNADGTKRTQKGWFLYDKNYYYLDKDGKMLTGWVYHDGNYYYMKSWGGMAHDEWILHDRTGTTSRAGAACTMISG